LLTIRYSLLLPYSTFSTYTRIVPPQESPTFQAVSSATPNSSVLGLPLSITSSASVTTAPSTQPPETLPRKLPSSSITRCDPPGRARGPQVSTTVASATPRSCPRQSSAAFRISSSRANMILSPLLHRYGHATLSSQAFGSPARSPPPESARTSSAIESRLWI